MLGFLMTPNTAPSQGSAPAKGAAANRGDARAEQAGEWPRKLNFLAFFNSANPSATDAKAADENASGTAEADLLRAAEEGEEPDSSEVCDEVVTDGSHDDDTAVFSDVTLAPNVKEHAALAVESAQMPAVPDEIQAGSGQSLQSGDSNAHAAEGEGGDTSNADVEANFLGSSAQRQVQEGRPNPVAQTVHGSYESRAVPGGIGLAGVPATADGAVQFPRKTGQSHALLSSDSAGVAASAKESAAASAPSKDITTVAALGKEGAALSAPSTSDVTGAMRSGAALVDAQPQPGAPIPMTEKSLVAGHQSTTTLASEGQSSADAEAHSKARHSPDELATALANGANGSGEAAARIGTPAIGTTSLAALTPKDQGALTFQREVSGTEAGASGDEPSQVASGLQATGAEARAALLTAQQAPAMPRSIAAQMIVALDQGADRPIDVILNPAELGRVRITLSHSDAGMVVNVAAERAETLDLMRRNSDMLGQEFSDLGYGGTEFTFARDGKRNDGDAGPGGRHQHVEVTMPVDAAPSLIALRAAPADRLDIRL